MVLNPANTTQEILICNTCLEHGPGIYEVIRRAFGVPLDEFCAGCFQPHHIEEQLKRFPEGHFVALDGEDVVGVAITMRTHHTPDEPPSKWLEAIGGPNMTNHEPDGNWLYGVEMAVLPAYQGRGIGTRLYEARFNLVKRLNLKGWYAGGILMGYHRYTDEMTVGQYAEKVIARELDDPTVTMQMRRGFEARRFIEDYDDEPLAGNGAIQIIWHNPDYKAD